MTNTSRYRDSSGGHGWLLTVACAVALIAGVLGWRWWSSDERAIRGQLTTIGAALTVPGSEGALGPVSRAAMLRKVLAPEVRVSAGGQEIVSRDAVLGLAARWVAPPGGITVEFADVHVSVADDRASADVYATVKLTSRDATTGGPAVDAREVTIGFVKLDGVWVVRSARTADTLQR